MEAGENTPCRVAILRIQLRRHRGAGAAAHAFDTADQLFLGCNRDEGFEMVVIKPSGGRTICGKLAKRKQK